jgi:thiol-disulfide isomerase/thioredoxin
MIRISNATFNRDQFKDYIQTLSDNDITIFYFTATWCGPCKYAFPIIERELLSLNDYVIENDLYSSFQIKMIKLDFDANREVASFLRVRSIPTLVLYVKNEREYINFSSKEENIVDFFKHIRTFTQ